MIGRFITLALLASPAVAQDRPPERAIVVTGTGVVRTAPDLATLEFWVRGEGATSDAAAKALADRQKAIVAGVSGLLGGKTEVTTGNVAIIEARDRGCEDNRGYGSQPRLSQGACAVVGYVATLQGSIRTGNVEKAGTAAGLAARLGASDARLQGFALADPGSAQQRATAAAIADARRRAEAAASGANVRLGDLISVRDQASVVMAQDIVMTGAMVAAPAPPPPPPPVPIDVKARPIETRASVTVSYAIAGG